MKVALRCQWCGSRSRTWHAPGCRRRPEPSPAKVDRKPAKKVTGRVRAPKPYRSPWFSAGTADKPVKPGPIKAVLRDYERAVEDVRLRFRGDPDGSIWFRVEGLLP